MNKALCYICFLYLTIVVMGQESSTQTIPNIPTSAIPAVPTELLGSFSSLLNNPSLLSQASAQISNLPTQFQSPAYSILSRVTATVSSVPSSVTDSPRPSDHSASLAYQSLHPVSMISALVIITFIASLL